MRNANVITEQVNRIVPSVDCAGFAKVYVPIFRRPLCFLAKAQRSFSLIRRYCSHLKRTIIITQNLLDRFHATPYSTAPLPPQWGDGKKCGEVSEWLKEHAWKVCIRQRIGGSNPPLTAIILRRARMQMRAFFSSIIFRR